MAWHLMNAPSRELSRGGSHRARILVADLQPGDALAGSGFSVSGVPTVSTGPGKAAHRGGEGVRRTVEARDNDRLEHWHHCLQARDAALCTAQRPQTQGLLPIGPCACWAHTSASLLQDKQWSTTLFAFHGRALPVLQWGCYMAYVAAAVTIVVHAVPNYADVLVMRGLQFPMTALGAWATWWPASGAQSRPTPRPCSPLQPTTCRCATSARDSPVHECRRHRPDTPAHQLLHAPTPPFPPQAPRCSCS
jgi:hypothetical protein